MIQNTGGYSEVLLDRFEMIYQDNSVFDMDVKIRKVNKARSFTGMLSIYQPLGNDFIIEAKILKKQGEDLKKKT